MTTNVAKRRSLHSAAVPPYVLYSNESGDFALPADAVFIVINDGVYPLRFMNDIETVCCVCCY